MRDNLGRCPTQHFRINFLLIQLRITVGNMIWSEFESFSDSYTLTECDQFLKNILVNIFLHFSVKPSQE